MNSICVINKLKSMSAENKYSNKRGIYRQHMYDIIYSLVDEIFRLFSDMISLIEGWCVLRSSFTDDLSHSYK